MVLDTLLPWQKRLLPFVRLIEDQYIIPVYIGAGLALARMHSRKTERIVQRQEHPVFRWMVMDGYGFYKGFYTPEPYIEQQRLSPGLSPYARHVFDQGLGRGIWFARGEDVERVYATISAFPEHRRADLWSGAAFAFSYAGRSQEKRAFEQLVSLSGPYHQQLSLAGALAAKRRAGLGYITPHVELASQVFCHLSAEGAASLANNVLAGLPAESSLPLHQVWRERIIARFEQNTASPLISLSLPPNNS
jgi:hypothetical protein